MGWVKGSDRNFEASRTERYRKTKKDRRERGETSGGDPKIRVRGRGSSTCAPGSGPRIAFAKNLRGQGSCLSTGQAEGGPHAPERRWARSSRSVANIKKESSATALQTTLGL